MTRNIDRIRSNHFHLRGAVLGLCFAVGASEASFLWGIPLIAISAWSFYRLDKVERDEIRTRDPLI